MGDHNGMRARLVTAVFSVILAGLSIMGIVTSPPSILISERRVPARFPDITLATILSTEFMTRFENFAADNFPFRDSFRSLNSATVFYVLMQTDKNGLYLNDHGVGEFRRVNPESVTLLAEKINRVSAALDGVTVYYSVIPDKSIYSSRYLPGFDAALTRELLTEDPVLSDLTYIELTEVLCAQSYYRTDLHWDQVMVGDAAEKLGAAMGAAVDVSFYEDRKSVV